MEIPNIQTKENDIVAGEIYEIFGMKLRVVKDTNNASNSEASPMAGTIVGCIHCALRELCDACRNKAGLVASFMPCADSNNFSNRHFVKVEE